MAKQRVEAQMAITYDVDAVETPVPVYRAHYTQWDVLGSTRECTIPALFTSVEIALQALARLYGLRDPGIGSLDPRSHVVGVRVEKV